jgi:hypothetical protein
MAPLLSKIPCVSDTRFQKVRVFVFLLLFNVSLLRSQESIPSLAESIHGLLKRLKIRSQFCCVVCCSAPLQTQLLCCSHRNTPSVAANTYSSVCLENSTGSLVRFLDCFVPPPTYLLNHFTFKRIKPMQAKA